MKPGLPEALRGRYRRLVPVEVFIMMEMLETVLMVSEGMGVPDVPVALIDTGCTRCMHGQRWRVKFEEICLAPMRFSNLRAGLDEMVSASDASRPPKPANS